MADRIDGAASATENISSYEMHSYVRKIYLHVIGYALLCICYKFDIMPYFTNVAYASNIHIIAMPEMSKLT